MAALFDGRLDIVTGPMFSGKTTELLRRLFSEAEIGLKVLYVNHNLDTRGKSFSTHNPLYKRQLAEESKVDFLSTDKLSLIQSTITKYNVVGIDESQFFGDLVNEVKILVDKFGMHVIVAGLNGDYNRNVFSSS